MDTAGPPPFFVVACARSGTTLLKTMLDRHPDLAIPPESHFIPRLWRQRRRYGRDGRVTDVERFLDDLTRERTFRYWELPREAVRQELLDGAGTGPTLSEAIAAPFRAYARRLGKSRWADKTPVYVEHVPVVASLFPTARVVHVVRDGRDVALSMLELDRLHRGPGSPALVWAQRVREGRRAGVALGPERYLELRYEDLVEDPEGALRRLCGFVDLSFDPAMLRHEEAAAERLPEEVRWMHRRLALPPTRGLRDWRTGMTPRQVARFEALAGRDLTRFGYPLGSGPGLRDRIAAWADVAGFAGRAAYRKVRRRARRRRGRRPQPAAAPASRERA